MKTRRRKKREAVNYVAWCVLLHRHNLSLFTTFIIAIEINFVVDTKKICYDISTVRNRHVQSAPNRFITATHLYAFRIILKIWWNVNRLRRTHRKKSMLSRKKSILNDDWLFFTHVTQISIRTNKKKKYSIMWQIAAAGL